MVDTWRRTVNDLAEIQQLLKQVADHLKAGSKTEKRQAIAKLERISAIAGTLALTLRVRD
jgi:hypothetical protein